MRPGDQQSWTCGEREACGRTLGVLCLSQDPTCHVEVGEALGHPSNLCHPPCFIPLSVLEGLGGELAQSPVHPQARKYYPEPLQE